MVGPPQEVTAQPRISPGGKGLVLERSVVLRRSRRCALFGDPYAAYWQVTGRYRVADALRNALVAVEMAMSSVLLVSASLLVQSIVRLQHQPLGVREDHLLKGHFYLPPARYPDAAAIARFSDAFAETVRALPGVVDATIPRAPSIRTKSMSPTPSDRKTNDAAL